MPSLREQGLQIVIDPTAWYKLKQDLDKFDPALTRALRRRIRNAGNVAAEAVREKLREPSPDGGPNEGVGRAALIAATRVSVSFGKRSAGTRITTAASRLPAEHAALLNVYNKAEFRHPLWGRDQWITQRGRPYFETAIQEVLDRALIDEINAAIDEATRAIGAIGT